MIEYVAEAGSTNADIAARLRGGEALREGFWLVADRQTAGSGRQGRPWLDGAGNFMGSTVVRPGPGDPAPTSLALLAGLAVHEVIAAIPGMTGGLSLKWPNDIMLGDAKLAGILLEAVDGAVVIGVGVNLVTSPALPDRRTAALADMGTPPDRNTFAEALERGFAIELERWRTAGIAPLLRRWCAAAHPVGTPLTVDEPGSTSLAGTFAGLDANGSLQLRLADGTVRTIHAGDVMLSPPPSA